MHSMLPRLASGLLCLALLGTAPDVVAAQASAPATADGSASAATPPVVRAGDRAVDGRRVHPGTRTLRMTMTQEGKEVGGADIRATIAEMPAAGEAGLLIAKTIASPRGTIYDTTLVRRRTLQPVWHHSTQPRRRMRLDFAPDSVTGAVTPNDSAAVPVAHHTAAPTFDSAVMEQVLAALPLARGYAVRLPFYIYERGGLVWYDVRVTGEETVPGPHGKPTAAWAVRLDRAELPMRSWIAKDSRELLRQEIDFGQGRRMVLAAAAGARD
jgi:hypothetical protein